MTTSLIRRSISGLREAAEARRLGRAALSAMSQPGGYDPVVVTSLRRSERLRESIGPFLDFFTGTYAALT